MVVERMKKEEKEKEKKKRIEFLLLEKTLKVTNESRLGREVQ